MRRIPVTHSFLLFVAVLLTNGILANSYFEKGLRAFHQKNYNTATELFRQAIEDDPNNLSVYYNLGVCAEKTGNDAEALWAFEKVLKYSPNDRETLLLAAEVHRKIHSDEYEPVMGQTESLLFTLSPNTWAILALLFSLLVLTSVIIVYNVNSNNWRKAAIGLGITSLFVMGGCLYLGFSVNEYQQENRYGLVIQQTPVSAFVNLNELGEMPDMQIQSGTRVQILSNETDFYQVETPDDGICYIKKVDLALI